MAESYPEWKRLREMLAVIAGEGFARLEAAEIIEFGRLYRRAVAELSFHRTHQAEPARLAFLNDLVGQCYPYVYTAPRKPWPSVVRFFTADFPQAVRRHCWWILLATLISLLPAVIGYCITIQDRSVADQVLPGDLLEAARRVAERHHTPSDWMPLKERPQNASFITTHNITICISSFAGGMTCGILTIVLLIFNGLMLGIVGAGVALNGPATTLNFWAFVAPHGVFELTAIFISGGAGLLLGYALVNPGEFPRRVVLREAGKEALKLMLGVCAMLVIAGTLEAFFSPLNIPEEIKLTAAAIEFVLLYGYFFLAGRRAAAAEPESAFGVLLSPVPPV